MKGSTCVLAFGFVAFAQVTGAHEYGLQFTPNSGARGLVVAGYSFAGNTVVGNCSYYTVHGGSGKGGGYKNITTYYNQTCTWDLYGNLLSITPGAPAVPAPLYTSGTQTVYAVNGTDFTGTDSMLPNHGFVNTPDSHYTWLTSNAYAVIQQMVYTVTATLVSDGDLALDVSMVEASALHGHAAVTNTTCNGQIAVGSTCSATVTYDPTKLCSTTGLAYDTLDIAATSNAGQQHDFTQSYTIVMKKVCDD
jgi:hypothetical protein